MVRCNRRDRLAHREERVDLHPDLFLPTQPLRLPCGRSDRENACRHDPIWTVPKVVLRLDAALLVADLRVDSGNGHPAPDPQTVSTMQ
jgi:hypothetical protein